MVLAGIGRRVPIDVAALALVFFILVAVIVVVAFAILVDAILFAV